MNDTPMRIAPSLLSADFARLGEEVTAVIDAGADLIYFDVMDNHYVPNLTVGPLVCQAIKPYCRNQSGHVPIDVHLMVKPVDSLITMFAQAGADIISFHPEASEHIDRSLQLIKSLLMSVNPGFGGQSFIESTLPKIEAVRKRIEATGRDIWFEVDGGVKADNSERIGSAGADTLVAGSAVFSGGRYQQSIHAIRTQALAGRHARVTLQ
jgi:ribulose-phosphate 3-epimerase